MLEELTKTLITVHLLFWKFPRKECEEILKNVNNEKDFTCPNTTGIFNIHIGGVDLLDPFPGQSYQTKELIAKRLYIEQK